MTIPFDYTDTRWDYPQGGIHKKTHRPFEACVVCGKPVYIDVPYLTIEVSWQNNEAMTPEDPREHSQGAFALGAGCLKNNPQLKPVVIKSSLDGGGRMSSNVYLHPKKMPSVAEWREWGKTVGIEYSPRTIGGSISYAGGGHGAREVEIDFRPDWNTGPGGTGAISIGTYFMGDLQAVAEVARKIYAAYPGKMSACPELEFVIDALGAERTTEDD